MDVAVVLAGKNAEFRHSPLKLAEYLASGVAVIAPAPAALPKQLNDGVDAVLVAPGDVEALAKRCARCATIRKNDTAWRAPRVRPRRRVFRGTAPYRTWSERLQALRATNPMWVGLPRTRLSLRQSRAARPTTGEPCRRRRHVCPMCMSRRLRVFRPFVNTSPNFASVGRSFGISPEPTSKRRTTAPCSGSSGSFSIRCWRRACTTSCGRSSGRWAAVRNATSCFRT